MGSKSLIPLSKTDVCNSMQNSKAHTYILNIMLYRKKWRK